MLIAFGLEAVGIWALSQFGHDPVSFVILSGLVFFAWGEIYSLFPSTCTDVYGVKYATTNAGLHRQGHRLAARAARQCPGAGEWRLAHGLSRRRGDEFGGGARRALRAAAVAAAACRLAGRRINSGLACPSDVALTRRGNGAKAQRSELSPRMNPVGLAGVVTPIFSGRRFGI